MIGSLKKTLTKQSSDKDLSKYIYYDSSALNLKKKISLNIIIENLKEQKLCVIIDQPTKELISLKIIENIENLTPLNGLIDIKPFNFYIKTENKENAERIILKTNSDFNTNIKDGINLYCKLFTSQVWIKIKAEVLSITNNLSIEFEIKANNSLTIKELKLLIIKRVLIESSEQLKHDKFHYFISSSNLRIEKGCINFEETLLNINNEIQFNQLFVKNLFDYYSEISVVLQFTPIEKLVFTEIQEKIKSERENENEGDSKLSISIIKFEEISFNEFIFKSLYENEYKIISKRLKYYFDNKIRVLTINEERSQKNKNPNFSAMSLDYENINDNDFDYTYFKRISIDEKIEEDKEIDDDSLPHIFDQQPSKSNENLKHIEEEDNIKPRCLVLLPNIDMINNENKNKIDEHFSNSKIKLAKNSKELKNPVKKISQITQKINYKSFSNSPVNRISLQNNKDEGRYIDKAILEDYVPTDYEDENEYSSNRKYTKKSKNELADFIKNQLLHISIGNILNQADPLFLNKTIDKIDIAHIRDLKKDIHDQGNTTKNFYYQPLDEILVINNFKILISIGIILLLYLIVVVIIIFTN